MAIIALGAALKTGERAAALVMSRGALRERNVTEHGDWWPSRTKAQWPPPVPNNVIGSTLLILLSLAYKWRHVRIKQRLATLDGNCFRACFHQSEACLVTLIDLVNRTSMKAQKKKKKITIASLCPSVQNPASVCFRLGCFKAVVGDFPLTSHPPTLGPLHTSANAVSYNQMLWDVCFFRDS